MGNSPSDIARKRHRDQTLAVIKQYKANQKRDTFIIVEDYTRLTKHVPKVQEVSLSSLLSRRSKASTASFITDAESPNISPLSSPALSRNISTPSQHDTDSSGVIRAERTVRMIPPLDIDA